MRNDRLARPHGDDKLLLKNVIDFWLSIMFVEFTGYSSEKKSTAHHNRIRLEIWIWRKKKQTTLKRLSDVVDGHKRNIMTFFFLMFNLHGSTDVPHGIHYWTLLRVVLYRNSFPCSTGLWNVTRRDHDKTVYVITVSRERDVRTRVVSPKIDRNTSTLFTIE